MTRFNLKNKQIVYILYTDELKQRGQAHVCYNDMCSLYFNKERVLLLTNSFITRGDYKVSDNSPRSRLHRVNSNQTKYCDGREQTLLKVWVRVVSPYQLTPYYLG